MCCGLWFPYYRVLDLKEQRAWALQREVKTLDKTFSMFLVKEESKGESLSSRQEEKNEFLRLNVWKWVVF